MSTIEFLVRVFNPHLPLVQTAEPQRPKVDILDNADVRRAYLGLAPAALRSSGPPSLPPLTT